MIWAETKGIISKLVWINKFFGDRKNKQTLRAKYHGQRIENSTIPTSNSRPLALTLIMIWKMFQQTRTNRQVWYQLIVKSQMCKSGLYAGPWRWSGKLTSNALLFMVGPGGADALDVAQFGQLHKSSMEICTKQERLLDLIQFSTWRLGYKYF